MHNSVVTVPNTGVFAAVLTAVAATLGASPDNLMGIVAGSLCGSLVFIISASQDTPLYKCVYFFVSFITGLLGHKLAAGVASTVMFNLVAVPPGIGALIASAGAIPFIQRYIDKHYKPKRQPKSEPTNE